MRQLIQIIVPADPPFSPMKFTRMPVVHRFWYGGVLAALAGFAMGFGLWMWQHGLLDWEGNYFLGRLWHARIQIEGFVGSFLLGFALQSGPHITGGRPPPSDKLLELFHLLWMGLVLTFAPFDWLALLGGALVSLAYGRAGYFLLRVTLEGNPQLRIPRGLPLAGGMTLMAAAPWLELDDAGSALFILWCGPVTMALVAAQQLINNVVGGRVLKEGMGLLFALFLALAWLVSAISAFTSLALWPLAGIFWLATLTTLVAGTDFVRVSWRFGWASINLTLWLGLLHALGCALLLMQEELPLDMAVHLLGAGALTTLILGVTARVAGFFSAGAVLPDRMISALVASWSVVALFRIVSPVLAMPEAWILWMSVLGAFLLLVWGGRTGYRLTRIRRLLPENMTGKQPAA